MNSDQQIGVFIEKWLLDAFGDFVRDFRRACGNVPEAGLLPVAVGIILFFLRYDVYVLNDGLFHSFVLNV